MAGKESNLKDDLLWRFYSPLRTQPDSGRILETEISFSQPYSLKGQHPDALKKEATGSGC